MSLKSMKNPPSPSKLKIEDEYNEPPEYPYGLEIEVTDEKVALLNLQKCKIGEEVLITAKAKVSRINELQRELSDGGEDASVRVSLQITDMDVNKESNDADRVKTLYE